MSRKKRRKTISVEDIPADDHKYEDIHIESSDRKGIMGFVETVLRRFRTPMFALFLSPIAILYILSIGLSASPSLFLLHEAYELTMELFPVWRFLILGISLACAWILYGLILIFIVPILNLPFIRFVKPTRCIWYSVEIVPWFYHNALVQLVRFTFLDIITPTPLNLLFFKLMGMKVGKGCVLNSSNISDPCLITLGDYVTIGGSATIFAHYGMKGYLIIDKVEIKRGSTIGLKASIMGGVVVGENNTIAPHRVIMPKTIIPDLDKPAN